MQEEIAALRETATFKVGARVSANQIRLFLGEFRERQFATLVSACRINKIVQLMQRFSKS